MAEMNDDQKIEKGSALNSDASIAVDPYAWVILLVVFLASVAAPLNQFKVPPLLPVLMDAFQLDLSQAGWLMSVFAITGLVLALPAGVILQRLGPKLTGLIAVGCLVIGSGLGALAKDAGLLLSSRVLEGAGMGLIVVVGPAAIALWFPFEKQGTPMGIWATWVPVGSLVMYNLAPAVEASFGWQAVWWLGAAFALIAFILFGLFMRLPPSLVAEQSHAQDDSIDETSTKQGSVLANRSIWLLALEFACFNIVLISFITYFPTFLAEVREYTLAQAGLTVSLATIAGIISALLSGWLSDRIGSRRLLISIPFLVVGVMMLFPFHLTGWQLYAFLVLFGFISAAIPTATFAAVPEVMGNSRLVGIGLAVVSLGMNLGILIGPILLGKLVQAMGWVVAGYWLIPVCVLGFVTARTVKVR